MQSLAGAAAHFAMDSTFMSSRSMLPVTRAMSSELYLGRGFGATAAAVSVALAAAGLCRLRLRPVVGRGGGGRGGLCGG